MRRASTFAVAAIAVACATGWAEAAWAQSTARALTWPGRGDAGGAPAQSEGRRPNPVIPHGGYAAAAPRPALTPAPGAPRRTLTPASAWLQPPAPSPSQPVQPALAAPDYLTDRGGQPAPAEAVYAPPVPAQPAPAPREPAPAPVADPMAPRRDAPIFRLQPQPPTAAAPVDAPMIEAPAAPRSPRVADVPPSGERPPLQGARYYSVHRQNGRQPDALEMPAPTYVDALAVTMAETPASQDLAQPDQGPTLIRDAEGRLRAAPAASDGDHQ